MFTGRPGYPNSPFGPVGPVGPCEVRRNALVGLYADNSVYVGITDKRVVTTTTGDLPQRLPLRANRYRPGQEHKHSGQDIEDKTLDLEITKDKMWFSSYLCCKNFKNQKNIVFLNI